MKSTILSDAVRPTSRTIRVAAAIFAISVASSCSKKDEECKTLSDAIKGVQPTLDIDVDAEKKAKDKADELEKFLEAGRSAQQALRAQGPGDDDVRKRRAQYQEALNTLVQRTSRLKSVVDQVSSATKQLAGLVEAKKKSKQALNTFLAKASEKETRSVTSTVLFGIPDKGPEAAYGLEKAASKLDEITFATSDAKQAAKAYAAALRHQAKAIRETGAVEDKLAKLEEESEALRDGFAKARTDLTEAHEAVGSTCAPGK